MKHSKKRIASIIVLSVIIAAGALFTAVYDVLYKYNTTNTTILNAATVDMTGGTRFHVSGTVRNGKETSTLKFDEGTYMVVFDGQGVRNTDGQGASCIAFYKGNGMTVSVGVPGGKGGASDGSTDGGGATYVQSNFALPVGTSAGTAIASGAGGGNANNAPNIYTNGIYDMLKLVDGCFAGYTYGGYYWDVLRDAIKNDSYDKGINCAWYPGSPARRNADGIYVTLRPDDFGTTEVVSVDCLEPQLGIGAGGGAGYYNGGGGGAGRTGGGGSCSPNCYSFISSDSQNGPKNSDGTRYRNTYDIGFVEFFRVDPTTLPSVDGTCTIEYGATATMTIGSSGVYTPVTALRNWEGQGILKNYDCGIRVGWVYSCSEDGEKWGASSDNLRSTAE